MVRYRLGGRYRRVKLGVYPELSLADARRRARQVVGEVATAQRGGEVHDMRWVDVDLNDRWRTIPGSVAKNGLAHRVPLSDLALEVLLALRDRRTAKMAASPYVLSPAARDPRRRRPTLARLGLSDFRGHDLRRTAASRMASAGCPRLVIGTVLNHAEPGVTAVYDRHTYDAEKRQALQTWARSLRALLDGDTPLAVVTEAP